MEITRILKQIDSLKEEAESLQPIKPEFEAIFWNKFRLDFDYNSNHLEGNTLTYGHTQLLLLFDKVGGDYSLRELEEMKAHDVAMKLVKEAALDPEHILTEKFIKEINETILVRPFYKEAITPDGQPTRRLIEPGKYKKYPNSVRLENGEIFNYASPEDTPAQMGDLMNWYRKETESKELHPVQLAALFHYRFVRIHPFDDSNGRTSRLLMNYILIRNGFAPAVIESTDKKNYLAALNRADTGDITAFVEYIGDISIKWQKLYTKALKGEKIEEPDDFRKDIELLKRKLKNTDSRIEFTLTNETLNSIFESSISLFLIKICEEISNFDDFFLSKNILLRYATETERSWNVNDFSREIPIVLNAIQQIIIKTTSVSLELRYLHNQLRKDNFLELNIATQVQLVFDTYTYEVYSLENEDVKLKKYYHQIISEEEAREFASLIAKMQLTKIKEAIIV